MPNLIGKNFLIPPKCPLNLPNPSHPALPTSTFLAAMIHYTNIGLVMPSESIHRFTRKATVVSFRGVPKGEGEDRSEWSLARAARSSKVKVRCVGTGCARIAFFRPRCELFFPPCQFPCTSSFLAYMADARSRTPPLTPPPLILPPNHSPHLLMPSTLCARFVCIPFTRFGASIHI